MVKLIEVIGRRPDLTHAYFLKHLSTTHLEVVDRVPEFRNRVRRYVQNHLFVDPNELADIHGLSISTNADGLIEVWWDRFSDIMGAFQEPRYLEIIRPDELAFGDVPGAWGVTAQETLVMERNGFSGLIKLFIFLKRPVRTPHAAFRSRWQAIREHQLSPATAFHTHVGRFVENWVSQDPAESLPGMKPYDLVAELWLESLQDVAQLAADPNFLGAVGGAPADHIDSSHTLMYVAKENPAAAEWLRKSQGRR